MALDIDALNLRYLGPRPRVEDRPSAVTRGADALPVHPGFFSRPCSALSRSFQCVLGPTCRHVGWNRPVVPVRPSAFRAKTCVFGNTPRYCDMCENTG